MKIDRRERRDWLIILLIILIGFLCLIIAGTMAIRFSPSWQLSANMDSHLDPNSDFLTNRPQGYIEPVDQAILTPAFWIGIFQTPGAFVPTRTSLPTTTTVPTSISAVTPTATIRTIPATVTLLPTNAIVYMPASPTNTPRPAPPPTDTPTNTASLNADLQITKTNGVLMYSAGSNLTYTIIVTNNGPANIIGAVITDAFPTQLEHWAWSCTAENGGASGCDKASHNKVNFSDTVDLPNGASIEYTVTAQVLMSATGDLVNTAQVDVPATNIESDPSNNLARDTDKFLPSSTTLPIGNIGTTPDGITDTVTSGNSVTFSLSGFLLDGNLTIDTVYYEQEETSSSGKIHLGNVQIEVYDQTTAAWYMIYNWGDDIIDTNASYNNGNSEPDGFPVDKSLLSGAPLNTGIAIDIDTPAIAQGGSIGDIITLIRITSLSNTNCEIDSMQMLR